MFCIVLDIELQHENVIMELGAFVDGKVQGYAIRCPNEYKLTKQMTVLLRAVKGEYFAKRTEKCKIFCNLLDEDVGKLEDHGCPKVQDLVDEEMWMCSSYPFTYKTTLHCGERKAILFGNWIMHHLDLRNWVYNTDTWSRKLHLCR